MKEKNDSKMFKILIRVFYVFFTFSFLIIFISSIFRNGCVYYKLNHLICFVLAILVMICWYFSYNFIKSYYEKISNKGKILLSGSIILVILLVLILLFCMLDVPMGWDYGVIYGQARSYVLTGDRLKLSVYPEYLQLFPNNISVFILEVILFKVANIFTITNFEKFAVAFNGFLIFLCVIFTWLYCKKEFGEKKGLFCLIICLFFLPLYLYLPIFYSDTMSVLFLPLLLYIYSFIDFSNSKIKNIVLIILFSVIMFIGVKMKMTILFLIFGIICDCFFKNKYKKLIVIISAFFIIYIGLNSMYNFITDGRFKVTDYGKIPITHWIMMGVEDPNVDNSGRNAYGGYNERDYKITQSYKNGEESIPRHIKEIKKRIYSYGFFGYINYLNKKSVNIWGDGSYYSDIKLNIGNQNRKSSFQKVVSGEDKNKILIHFEQGVQLALLLILVLSGIYSFIVFNKKDLIIHVPIFIIMLFLLLWEGRSRYLYNYIPLFIILIVKYIDKLKYIISKKGVV